MNILLIAADALRADHLSCYGYRRYTSPFIDLIAENGCVFQQAFSVNNTTDPCFTSLHTGQFPITHGITGMYGPQRHDKWLNESTPVMAELLQNSGYETIAVDSLQKWFKRGFDHYLIPNGSEKPVPIQGCVFNGDAVTDTALSWAENRRNEQPYFLFIHYWDTHAPYQPPTRFGRLFEDDELWQLPLQRRVYTDIIRQCSYTAEEVVRQVANYDREVAYLDAEIERLIAGLDSRGMLENTMIIFTSDHGESLYEHDVMFTHHNLHDPTVHIPLIISAPGPLPTGKKIRGLVSQVDIMPTVLELVEMEIPRSVEGNSLVSAARRGRVDQEVIYLEEGSHQRTRALRTKDWKFIKSIKPALNGAPPRELYYIRRDPKETYNLWEEKPKQAAKMEASLKEWVNTRGGDYDNEETMPWKPLFGPYKDKVI